MAQLQDAIDSVSDSSILHICPVSGGKDSAALAIYMKREYPFIPMQYVFSDTQCELPETYDFLGKLSELLGQEIIKINALDYMRIEKKPGRIVFDILLNEYYGGFLPSPRARWCTVAMKIKPFEKWIGDRIAYSYIAIRGDENRQGYVPKKPPVISKKPNIRPIYPFKENQITLNDVAEVLNSSGIGFPEYYKWRSRSGCYFCFYQQIAEWQGLKERFPELFKKAKSYEKTTGSKKFTWVDGKSLEDIEKLPKRYEIQPIDQTNGCAICQL